MTARDKLEKFLVEAPEVKAACFYGSGRADLDYMIFTEKPLNPSKIWPEGIWQGSPNGLLAIVGEEFFDLSVSLVPVDSARAVKLGDMLRNSEPAPHWFRDEEGDKSYALTFAARWVVEERKRLNDAEILSLARALYINQRFIARKMGGGLHYVRGLIARGFEPNLFALAREVDLRRGGKGLYKGRDAATIWTPAELENMTVYYSLDEAELNEALVRIRRQTLFWLAQLKISVPAYLCKPW